jgi:Secretion system C-terminal sorting domain
MKFYIVLFMVCCFLTNMRGGNPTSCKSPNPCPNTWGIRNPNQGGASGQGLKNLTVTNRAYFNLREAPPRTQLNVRSATPISVTEQDMLNLMSVGRVEHNFAYVTSRSVSMNIGIADNANAQTWVLPNTAILTTPDADVTYNFIAPTSVTPATAQIAGATHVRKTTFVNDENNTVTFYKHFKMVAADELEELGASFVENGVVYDYDEPAQIYADAPLDLGDAFQTSITSHDDEDPLPRTTAVCDVVVDGFGSITTPFGNTYQCLRLSLTRVETRETDAQPGTSETDYLVVWVTREGFRFYATKPTQNASGMTTLTKLDMYYFENAILEVELLTFEGKMNKNAVDLTWTTANEKNNVGFDVERSADGKTFEKIGFVKGSGTTNLRQSYAFTDNDPLSISTYYRLRQVDFDGTSTTSNVISIEQKGSGKGLKVYPNPSFDNQISIELSENTVEARNPDAFGKGVSVTNVLGQVIFQQKTIGQNSLQLDISTWEKGVYFVKTMDETVKFVKN